MSTGVPISGRRSGVRVVVAGDPGTGKSSLIAAAESGKFPESVAPVLPPTHLPADFSPDGVPVTIIDTSSASLEGKAMLEEELKQADVVVLTFACDEPETLSHLQTVWIQEVRRLEVKVPVIVVGCISDLGDEKMSLQDVMTPIRVQCREIERFIEFSAAEHANKGLEVFRFALISVLYPTAPLIDKEYQTFKPRCMRALKMIFHLCDHDRDKALNDQELSEFQLKCIKAPMQPQAIEEIKSTVQQLMPEGVNQTGLTLIGFVCMHADMLVKGNVKMKWTVLRMFGYNDDLELQKENIPVPTKKAPDQSVELNRDAVDFLKMTFRRLDSVELNKDAVDFEKMIFRRLDGGELTTDAVDILKQNFSMFDNGASQDSQDLQLQKLFINAPESPWGATPYQNSVERKASTQSGFLSQMLKQFKLDYDASCQRDN